MVTWASPQTFTPGTDIKVDFSVGGKLLAVRFESTADVDWELDGYDIDLAVTGRF